MGKEYVKDLLSGVNGAGAGLVTEAPAKKKKLRYTFNTALRQKRLEDEVEDETDDEEEGGEELMEVRAEAEEGYSEIRVTGGGPDGAAEQAGRTKHPDKPMGKRGMSASYYDWQNKDLAQPHASGMYDSSFDGQLGLRGRQTSKRKAGKTTKHFAVGSHHGIFERLAREEGRGGSKSGHTRR